MIPCLVPRSLSLIAATAASLAVLAGLAPAGAQNDATTGQASARAWMTEDAMRADFAGQTLDGHYGNQMAWTETYLADGRIDYKESSRFAKGRWHFRAGTFCTFYDPPFMPDFVGGCWQVLKQGVNCYEFYSAGVQLPGSGEEDGDDASGLERPLRWNARGWRTSQPSTCPEKPSV
jgi:hypothetical protein